MAMAVATQGLVKAYGPTRALDGLDIEVEQGTVVGVLGPNGAGKTTLVRILATLLAPTGGRAEVMGIDVTKDPQAVRASIGLTGQYAAVDEGLTGRENLVMIGRLAQIGRREAKGRAVELLERFDLTDAADRLAKTYSGGMRRRLDLAASLVGQPAVLFLDEPTTGLDPRSRLALWEVIRHLVAEGTTLLLTTQYLDEADQLADSIVVIDHGRVIARGTADELKDRVGGEVLALRPEPASAVAVQRALEALGPLGAGARVDDRTSTISLPVGDRSILTAAGRRLDEAGVALADLGVRRPSLDDVFLTLTGHAAEEEVADDAAPTRRRGRERRGAA